MLPNCCLHIPRLLPFCLKFQWTWCCRCCFFGCVNNSETIPTNQPASSIVNLSVCVCLFRKVKLVTSANNWVCSLEQLLPFTWGGSNFEPPLLWPVHKSFEKQNLQISTRFCVEPSRSNPLLRELHERGKSSIIIGVKICTKLKLSDNLAAHFLSPLQV